MLVIIIILLSWPCLLIFYIDRTVFEVFLGLVYQFFPLMELLLCTLDFLHFFYFFISHEQKNMPWHILAPGAAACGIFLLRASAHPPGGFYDAGKEVSNIIKSSRSKPSCS